MPDNYIFRNDLFAFIITSEDLQPFSSMPVNILWVNIDFSIFSAHASITDGVSKCFRVALVFVSALFIDMDVYARLCAMEFDTCFDTRGWILNTSLGLDT